jgi:hypothetical protein
MRYLTTQLAADTIATTMSMSVVAFIVTVQLSEKRLYRTLGKVMVTVRMIKYRTVEVKLIMLKRSHPMSPSQP